MARDEPKSAKGSSMIGAFVTQIATMTAHVFHGKSQSVLNTNHRLLTCERQLHMCACLDRAQTNTGSVHGIIKNTRLFVSSHRAMRTKKRQSFNHGSHFSSVVGVCSGTRKGQVCLGGDDPTKHDVNLSTRGSGRQGSAARDTLFGTRGRRQE